MNKVSIIIPVYNGEKRLKRCVDSILMQDYPDFELILVDDGSRDSSLQIMEDYARQDARVKAIHSVGLSMMCYTGGKEKRTCFGERQLSGRMGKSLYLYCQTASCF